VRVFCLTPLTRGAGNERRAVVKGFDVRVRTMIIAGVAAVPALVVAAIAWAVIGVPGLLALPLVEALAFWLVEARTRSGLRLRTYQALTDRRKAKSEVGKFFVAGHVYDPLGEQWYGLRPGSAPSRPLFRVAPAQQANSRGGG
jgi:hypothetical protein